MSRRSRTIFLALASMAICFPALAARDPLQRNLGALEQRLQKSSPKASARPRYGRRSRVRFQRGRAISAPRAARAGDDQQAVLPQVSYQSERVGTREKAGDLRVAAAAGGGLVHVYLGQRLVSFGGNGQASVPDLAPGRHPVSVWAIGRRKRKTFGVRVLPGQVACLRVRW